MENASFFADRRSDYFHAHIYFDAASRPSAAALQQSLLLAFPQAAQVSRLIDRPVGPHPVPMFEVDFLAKDYPTVRAFLEAHHGPHSVLIHQNTDDEVWNHTEGADWLGEKLPLDIEFLRRL